MTFVSKQQGLQQLKAQLGEDSKILEGLEGEENPLPDTLVIVPQNPQRIEELAKKIKAHNMIEDEDHGDGVTDKFWISPAWSATWCWSSVSGWRCWRRSSSPTRLS